MEEGSTTVPADRFYQHLVSAKTSNAALQMAIDEQGLQPFTAFVFETVSYDKGMTYVQRKELLRTREQHYLNQIPVSRLYNSIKASV